MVHLANPESTGGSASAEDELSECDMAALSSETKRNTQQNESLGEGVADTEDTAPELTEQKNSGRGPHNSNFYNRSWLRSKNVARSEDMEADDELVSRGHFSMMCYIVWSSLTFNQHIAQGPQTGAVAESGGAEHAAVGDLVKQLQEKDCRIQYLELKIQQLSQVRRLPPTHHLIMSIIMDCLFSDPTTIIACRT